jgi:hypothetical protein
LREGRVVWFFLIAAFRPDIFAIMMGHRGKTDGDQRDAFSRRSRRMIIWRSGALRTLKRRFCKAERRESRLLARALIVGELEERDS